MDVREPDVQQYYELAAGLGADAMLCGSETMVVAYGPDSTGDAIADVLKPGAPRPLLVVVDSQGRVKCWDRILAAPHWRSGVSLGSASTPLEHLKYLKSNGVETIIAGETRVDLASAFNELAVRHRVKLIRVDSGGTLNGVLLREKLVDELALLIAPVAIGGDSAKSVFQLPDHALKHLAELTVKQVEIVRNQHVWLHYNVLPPRG